MANHAEIRQFREDIRPIKEFMQDVTAAKKAAIWMVGIFAAMGAAVTWIINLKSHVETHIK